MHFVSKHDDTITAATETNLPSISNNSAIPLCFSVSKINLSAIQSNHTFFRNC